MGVDREGGREEMPDEEVAVIAATQVTYIT